MRQFLIAMLAMACVQPPGVGAQAARPEYERWVELTRGDTLPAYVEAHTPLSLAELRAAVKASLTFRSEILPNAALDRCSVLLALDADTVSFRRVMVALGEPKGNGGIGECASSRAGMTGPAWRVERIVRVDSSQVLVSAKVHHPSGHSHDEEYTLQRRADPLGAVRIGVTALTITRLALQ